MVDLSHPFLSPLKELSNLLSKTKTEGVVIGGISVGLIGKPRFTADIDAVILLNFEQIEAFVKTATAFGFEPRISDVGEFARKTHVILLVHKKTGINIDLSIGLLPFEHEIVQRAKKFESAGVSFYIPTPEDLIIMKAVAHRPKDLEDIRMIVQANPELDRQRIKRWVEDFAQTLEMPEIWKDVEKLLIPVDH
ncbi:MAG: nucleotidyltransferase [Deltaproteobacteria bacterium]|nr:nucleotidyltransferase [Deltaproteobacteria bacterium]